MVIQKAMRLLATSSGHDRGPQTGQLPPALLACFPHQLQAGSNINDVQAKTYARIQLSKANEYFPGTTERTLLVTGRLKQVGGPARMFWRCVVHQYRPGRGTCSRSGL